MLGLLHSCANLQIQWQQLLFEMMVNSHYTLWTRPLFLYKFYKELVINYETILRITFVKAL